MGSTDSRSAGLAGGLRPSSASDLSICPRSSSAALRSASADTAGFELSHPAASPTPTATTTAHTVRPIVEAPGNETPRAVCRPGQHESDSRSIEADVDFPALLGANVPPDLEVDRIPDEPNGTVSHADVHPARVIARRGNVGPAEAAVAAGVLLIHRVLLLPVPVDRQGVRVEGLVVDPAAIVLQPDVVDPPRLPRPTGAPGHGPPIVQARGRVDGARDDVGCVIDGC